MKNIKFVLERANEENRETIIEFRRKLLIANDIEESLHTQEAIAPDSKHYYIFVKKKNNCIGMHEIFKYEDKYDSYFKCPIYSDLKILPSNLPPFNQTAHLRSSYYINPRLSAVYLMKAVCAINHICLLKSYNYLITSDLDTHTVALTKKLGFSDTICNSTYFEKKTYISFLDNRTFINKISPEDVKKVIDNIIDNTGYQI